jgi:hypothetical protein
MEILAEAVGEEVPRTVERRGRKMLGNIIRAALPKMSSTSAIRSVNSRSALGSEKPA